MRRYALPDVNMFCLYLNRFKVLDNRDVDFLYGFNQKVRKEIPIDTGKEQ